MTEDQDQKNPIVKKEEEILKFWQENKIFNKTLEKESPKGNFVFYEGPPTANGKPGIHHLEARAFKDAIPRYKTMQGFHVRRIAGWDTHGLPVELAVEKELGFKSKIEIEKYGIAEFNKKCRESVMRYVGEWAEFTDRIGYWVDKENAYFTYNPSFMESVWNVIKKADEQNLLFKDYKIVPWCPRCGTTLSSHELAQGYQDDKDLTVYAKFKFVGQENTFFLAWTTTPWTLPGNVALAVGEDIDYVKIKSGEEFFVLAKNRLGVVSEGYEILEEIKGKDLVGLEYEPLYPFLKDGLPVSEKEKLEKSFRVYSADFVTTEDGTGIVHIAPMYGSDDFELGTRAGLPKFHLVKEDGTFINETGFLSGKFVKDEDTAVEIIKDLAHRGLLFKKEKYEHSYPHCWRCKTALIYFARDSWYIRMSELREKLIAENERINWEPNYIKEGRFGEWLKDVKDWAISRERYWGTPLPVWVSEDGSEKLVVGSVLDLKKHTKKSGNKYILMRHGQATQNVEGVLSSTNKIPRPLTEKGKEQVLVSAEKLKEEKIDIIIHSPIIRARQTAEAVLGVLGNKQIELIEDSRIREEDFGELSDVLKCSDFLKYFPDFKFRLDTSVSGCETLRETKKRMGEFIYDIEKKYSGKNILIISHDGPLKLLLGIAEGADDALLEKIYLPGKDFLTPGHFVELPFVTISHNEDYVLDLHKPFIDEISLVGQSGKDLTRAKEVMDVWFDSGAMPFAQDHYPFENKDLIDKEGGYPADFISEAIDQTRGWFYTLHAIGTLMEKGRAFKNVICLGHLNDKFGKKMSKSVGNIVEPWAMMNKYGADALRLWMYSVNQPGEPKNFDEKTVDEIVKKNFNLLSNILTFYMLYRDLDVESDNFPQSKNVLDIWILSRLSELTLKSTQYLEEYKLLEPVRMVREFIDDLSTWYLRRSRDRIKEGDKDAKQTLYFVLKNISKILAPFAPFYAESLFQELKIESDDESVHLEEWPGEKADSGEWIMDSETINQMQKVREICSLGLKARSDAKINVRQPLSNLKIKNQKSKLDSKYLEIIKEEINVKEIIFDDSIQNEIELDASITPELKEEGIAREIMRAIQDLRKKSGLRPDEKVVLKISSDEKIQKIIKDFEKEIAKVTGLASLNFSSNDGEEISIDGSFLRIQIVKN